MPLTRKFSESVAKRIATDHEFCRACLEETQDELAAAEAALRTARVSLRLWNMDTSYIDAIVGPDGYNAPQASAELGSNAHDPAQDLAQLLTIQSERF
jgi:hypothetical protein